jgi:formylglycine-generating enzyme required for sulfatase activity
MKLVLVPRGTFWMCDRGSQRQVVIPRDFYIGAYPVTQGQWQALMGSNPSWFSRDGRGADKVKYIPDAGLKQFPVECVSWNDIQNIVERLNIREKDRGFLYRLPTEAEWEYSCRGGATSQAECAFDFYFAQPTDDLSSEQANFDGNYPASSSPKGKYLKRTTKVGSYPPNWLGLHDMHGNVWEWCSEVRMRGGSWRQYGPDCRASIELLRYSPRIRLTCPFCRYDNEDGAEYCEQCKSDLAAETLNLCDLGFRLVAVPSGG